jgi:MoxR-like ATPase
MIESAIVEQTLTAEQFTHTAQAIESEVGKLIVGQREIVRQTLITLLAGGNALLEGVPGLGKTMLVRTLAQVLDCKFSRIQFTPDLMPADIVGTNILVEDENGRRRFQFEPGPVFSNLVLAMLEVMQEHSVTVAKVTHRMEEPFFVLATQNPLEMEGTYPLPEAQLDRFFFKLQVEFPSAEELATIADRTTGLEMPRPQMVANAAEIVAMQQLARGVPIAPHVTAAAARLVRATHPDDANAPDLVKRYVKWGSSPRGMQAVILAGKIIALLDGRYNVALEDLREASFPALRHRLILNFEAQAEGMTPDRLVKQVGDSVLEKE